MKIADKNVFNFHLGLWVSGKVILIDNDMYIVSREENLEAGDLFATQISRRQFVISEPATVEEAEYCNNNIPRKIYKVIVHPEQLKSEDKQNLVDELNTYVLVKCYPCMDGPGQDGWIVDNDVDGESNKVTLHYHNNNLKIQ